MKKIVLVFCCILLMGLTGCGGSGDSSTTNAGLQSVPGTGTSGETPAATNSETKTVTSTPGNETGLSLSDNTKVTVPATTSEFTLTVQRQPNTTNLTGNNLKSIGSMRVVTYDNLQLNSAFPPVSITFPSSEYSSSNKDTLAVARISDIVADGTIKKDTLTVLPAYVDSSGNITATDIFLPITDAVTTKTATKSLLLNKIVKLTGTNAATVKYSLITYQDNLNWSRPALLTRMVPDKVATSKRKPLDTLSATDKSKEENRCVKNVVVLVHGHNEGEKNGLTNASDIGSPWFYSYKRDVWTTLYDTFMTKYDARANCTAFYEYIYPSYKSAFDDLGPDLATKLKSELKSYMSPKDADLNILIVAHSMGGLVARSAIQSFDADLHKAFQSLVTWGTPHRGSALTSLQYVLNSDLVYKYVFDELTMSMAIRYATNGMQIDTPGNRDLRWDNSRPLSLDEWFTTSPYHTGFMSEYRLDKGTRLYNTKLSELNNNDIYGSGTGSNLKNKSGFMKYNFAYGITTNKFPSQKSFVSIGATLERNLLKNPLQTFEGVSINEGDGAVTVTSMAAEGLQGYRMSFGDYNHEEYYGAPVSPAEYDGLSSFTQLNKAKTASELTLSWLMQELDANKSVFKCDPFISSITPSQGAIGNQVTINGRCFNNLDNKLSVSFNSLKAETIQVKNCNEIIATVPIGATTGNVVVTANGVESNGMNFKVTSDTPVAKEVWWCKNFSYPGVWTTKYDGTYYCTGVKTPLAGYVTINVGTTSAGGTAITSKGTGGNWSIASSLDSSDQIYKWNVELGFNNGSSTYIGTVQADCSISGYTTDGGCYTSTKQ